MIWAFIDYENVGSLESLDLSDYQRLIVFIGPRHRRLTLGEIPTDSFSQLDLIRMKSSGNNNLDFHLAFYMGARHQIAGKDVEFHIISNDTGFDGITEHMVDIGRPCRRINTSKKKAVKKVVKKAATKKTAAKKTVAKKAPKKKAATKKMATKKQTSLKVSVTNTLNRLREREETARPHTQTKLVNWIANLNGKNEQLARQIYDSLVNAKKVIQSGSKVTYGL